MFKQFFNRKLAFQPIDPLGDGLGDDIAREQSNPETLAFQEDINGERLIEFWSRIMHETRKDPDWFGFDD